MGTKEMNSKQGRNDLGSLSLYWQHRALDTAQAVHFLCLKEDSEQQITEEPNWNFSALKSETISISESQKLLLVGLK